MLTSSRSCVNWSPATAGRFHPDQARRQETRQATICCGPAADLQGTFRGRRQRNPRRVQRRDGSRLVTTDIAARGIHVDGIDLVLHVDPPAEHKTYLHRCGALLAPARRAWQSRWALTASATDPTDDPQGRGVPDDHQRHPGDEAIREIVARTRPRSYGRQQSWYPVQQARRRRPGAYPTAGAAPAERAPSGEELA